MLTAELRQELTQIREHVLRGDVDGAIPILDRALKDLDADRLLTTSEAADLLGIRSVNTLKVLLRMESVPTVQRGNRTMIAVAEVERLQNSERVRGLQVTTRIHEATASFGEEPVSSEELAAIEAGRPGKLPWVR